MGRKKEVVEFEESPPDDFDPSNPYKDPMVMLEMREHVVREKWIAIEKIKILRERLCWCYASKVSTTTRNVATSSRSTWSPPVHSSSQLGTPSSSRGSGTTRRFGVFGFWV
ncbi:unnamed protein product [Linum trigynum]|uniref:Uncharacterized protein n=1 Tax=Linum trigynum TaxID=586398 RepID=A0AAV2CV14_9ROSI